MLVGAVGACFVLYEGETLPQIVPGEIGTYWLAVQTGFTLSLAMHFGFEGVQVLFGTLLGLAYAVVTDFVVHSVKSEYAFFGWCCAGAALGMFCFTVIRTPILATLTPLFGGLLITSGGCTILAHLGVLGFLSPELVWVDAVIGLFGNGGTGNFACQVLLALLGAAAFKAKPEPKIGAVFVVVGLVFSALAASTGFGCGLLHNCPSWLVPVTDWHWPVLGSLVWMVCAGAGTFLQLNMANTRLDEERDAERRHGKSSRSKSKDLKSQRDLHMDGGGAPETQGLLTDPHLGQLAGQQYSGMGGYGGYGNDHGAYHGNYG